MPLVIALLLLVSYATVRALLRRIALLEARLAVVEQSVRFLGARDAAP